MLHAELIALELSCEILIVAFLIAAYPFRLLRHINPHRPWSRPLPLAFPASFDPAPIFYPPTITTFVSILLFIHNPAGLLPGIILSISSLPRNLIPSTGGLGGSNTLHWALSSIPLLWVGSTKSSYAEAGHTQQFGLDPEILVLIHPLHQALCTTLHHLTTTSLLPAELQLLSIASIYLLLQAFSPQAVILKAVLWIGGIGLLVTCERVLRWAVALARVPRWRLRRAATKPLSERASNFSVMPLVFGRAGTSVFASVPAVSDSSDDEYSMQRANTQDTPAGAASNDSHIKLSGSSANNYSTAPNRSHTLPSNPTHSRIKNKPKKL